jgi:hypothetical protein
VVEEGKPAPDFSLTSNSGEEIRLSQLRGGPVVLFLPSGRLAINEKQSAGTGWTVERGKEG